MTELTQVGLITQIEQLVLWYRTGSWLSGPLGSLGLASKAARRSLMSTRIFRTQVPRWLQRGVIKQFSEVKAGSGKAT